MTAKVVIQQQGVLSRTTPKNALKKKLSIPKQVVVSRTKHANRPFEEPWYCREVLQHKKRSAYGLLCNTTGCLLRHRRNHL